MTTFKTLFGCGGVRGALDAYARRFDAIELDVLDRAPKAKDATLRKWRKDAGPGLRFSLVAPKPLAAVRPGAPLDAALTELLEAQRLVQARTLLLSTPVEVTPAALPRERLAKVVERLREGLGEARNVVSIAWEPRGVWEQESAAKFARELGIDLCADPLADPREPFWDASIRYVRLTTVGGRTEFPPARLRALAEILSAAQQDDIAAGRQGDRVVIFNTPHAATEVKRLKALVAQLATREAGKEIGNVIRPRGFAIDDEEDEDEEDEDDEDESEDEGGEPGDEPADDDEDDDDDDDDDEVDDEEDEQP